MRGAGEAGEVVLGLSVEGGESERRMEMEGMGGGSDGEDGLTGGGGQGRACVRREVHLQHVVGELRRCATGLEHFGRQESVFRQQVQTGRG